MSEPVVQVEAAAAFYIRQVKRKLAMGTYPTEPVACFCGSSSAVKVTDWDRYGFDHRMWLCKDCGVLYANPRMTDAAYAEFYATEYRHIYDDNERENSVEQDERGQRVGTALRDYLVEQYDKRPAVVFDIGCNAGAWLTPFLEAGAEVHGVDYGLERIAEGKAKGLNIHVGSIEALEILEKKADLIILNHVLEHATDIEAMLTRIRGLLSDDGMLFVSMPGLFAVSLDAVFQNAHPWQFTAETLTYVMECCGFEEVRCDHSITSLWKKTEEIRPKEARPNPRFIRDIAMYLSGKARIVPSIRAVSKFSTKDRREWIAASQSRGLPDLSTLIGKHQNGTAIVIGGGSSVDQDVDTIKQLQADGAVIFAIERMYPWCLQHGITPEYVVTLDASHDVVEAFEVVHDGTTFIVATQCQPAVFDALLGESVCVFHSSHRGIPEEELRRVDTITTEVNAGGSVVLCAMSIAMTLRCPTIHLFGFDCHVSGGGYAKGIAGVGEQVNLVNIKVGERKFITTVPYMAFAQQFHQLVDLGREQGLLTTVKVYGDSLVTAMNKELIGGTA